MACLEDLQLLKLNETWQWLKVFNRFCSWALIIVGLIDVMWNFGLIQTLMNWASKLVAMAFALLAVEEIELKRRVALVGCQEILWILSVVDWSYSSLKWHTIAVAARRHLPHCSCLMTECSCVQWPLQSPTARRFLRFPNAFFNLLTIVLRALWLVNFFLLLSRLVCAKILFMILLIIIIIISLHCQTIKVQIFCYITLNKKYPKKITLVKLQMYDKTSLKLHHFVFEN